MNLSNFISSGRLFNWYSVSLNVCSHIIIALVSLSKTITINKLIMIPISVIVIAKNKFFPCHCIKI